jgi:hypothetical protein
MFAVAAVNNQLLVFAQTIKASSDNDVGEIHSYPTIQARTDNNPWDVENDFIPFTRHISSWWLMATPQKQKDMHLHAPALYYLFPSLPVVPSILAEA